MEAEERGETLDHPIFLSRFYGDHIEIICKSLVVVVPTFDPSIPEAEARRAFEFQARMFYRVSSRRVKATQRNLL